MWGGNTNSENRAPSFAMNNFKQHLPLAYIKRDLS